jgi:hypothetical protein
MGKMVKAEYKTAKGCEGAARTMSKAARDASAQGNGGQAKSAEKTAGLYRRQAEAARRRGQ